ncbi:hypothetical protein SLEP1_g43581 [Rubroshorea leprosula]|uniref:FAD-binding domain-containing protein n=1 Tax=Rubroshorea leprosula TaxID=152421 RepID=A0AAV5LDS3_9ROSI|nr:hypothetical protein SLEP1_g43581 [Rubroshorea leprosula]
MSEDDFLKAVNHALDYGYGPHPTSSLLARRVVLIGDAAHIVHPFAGQGVNMGFGDASALSRIIAEGVAVGTGIGEV